MGTRALMASTITPTKFRYLHVLPPSSHHQAVLSLSPFRCAPLQQTIEEQQQQQEVEATILCDSCDGRGWLLCDFCEGQKTNVKSKSNRIYRRCPSCRAIGYTLCSKCKVFKCVTFPDQDDGNELNF